MSLKLALTKRRSTRAFAARPLTEEETTALLFAAQGITSPSGYRTAPSAGATYPLEIYIVTQRGIFHYLPGENRTEQLSTENLMHQLADAALGQHWVETAAANFVFAGVVERTAKRYGQRATRYVAIEVGSAAQNLMLSATALELGSVMVGAYDDNRVKSVLHLPTESIPFAIVSVGAVSTEK